jgi:hypothetical protein
MTYPQRNLLAIGLASMIVLIILALAFVVLDAHSQPRITPKVVCERNGAGWVYIPATNQCYGPGTHAPEPASEPLCRSHSRNLENHKRTVSEWMPCREITKCRKPCWIERERVK